MAEEKKGIELKIGGDTSELTKALDKVKRETNSIQKELNAVNKLLELDPQNTELLAQKQELLSNQVGITEKKLEALKEAKVKADEDMKNGTEINEKQYRSLQREIVATEQSLNKLKESEALMHTSEDAEKAQEEMKELKEEVEKTGAETESLGGKTSKAGSLIKSGFGKKAVAAVAGVTAAFVAAAKAVADIAENTREYREDMNRLETAFETSEKTAEQARKSYSDFYVILGESDRSVEAVNHLAKLCKSEEELAKWSNICAGVSATFGDSLPIEGLTEAANETAKVTKVTGPLADALNWIGISEDAFNDKLAACSSEQERSVLITNTLADAYKQAGDEFRAANSDIIKNREAQQELDDVMARIGAAAEPYVSSIKKMSASVLGAAVDYVDSRIKIAQETNKLVNTINEENQAWDRVMETQKSKAEADVAEIDYTNRLYNELTGLVDENGHVIETNKNRVNFIVGELQNALGIEIQLTGDQIRNYGELSKSIDDLIQKKRAEIILAAQEEAYKKAITEVNSKQQEQSELYLQILEKEQLAENLRAEAQRTHSAETVKSYGIIRDEVEKLKGTYDENDGYLNEYYATITNYETGYAAIMSGDAEKIKEINNGVGESFRVTGEKTEKELKKQIAITGSTYAEIQRKVDEGVKGVTQEMADEALVQYNNAKKEYEKIGRAIPEGMQVGVENGKPVLKSTIGGFTASLKGWIKKALGINSPSKWGKKIGGFLMQGIAEGIKKDMTLKEATEKKISNLKSFISDELGVGETDIKLSEAEFELWSLQNPNASEEGKSNKQIGLLMSKINKQSKAVQIVNDALYESVQLTGENSKESRDYQLQLVNERIELEKLNAEMQKALEARRQIYSQGQSADGYGSSLRALNKNPVAYMLKARAGEQTGGQTVNNVTQNYYGYKGTVSENNAALRKTLKNAEVVLA